MHKISWPTDFTASLSNAPVTMRRTIAIAQEVLFMYKRLQKLPLWSETCFSPWNDGRVYISNPYEMGWTSLISRYIAKCLRSSRMNTILLFGQHASYYNYHWYIYGFKSLLSLTAAPLAAAPAAKSCNCFYVLTYANGEGGTEWLVRNWLRKELTDLLINHETKYG